MCPGMLRTLVTKAMGYHVHAAEYGEHWNFFLTLGALPVLSALANIPPQWLLPAGEQAPTKRARTCFCFTTTASCMSKYVSQLQTRHETACCAIMPPACALQVWPPLSWILGK